MLCKLEWISKGNTYETIYEMMILLCKMSSVKPSSSGCCGNPGCRGITPQSLFQNALRNNDVVSVDGTWRMERRDTLFDTEGSTHNCVLDMGTPKSNVT